MGTELLNSDAFKRMLLKDVQRFGHEVNSGAKRVRKIDPSKIVFESRESFNNEETSLRFNIGNGRFETVSFNRLDSDLEEIVMRCRLAVKALCPRIPVKGASRYFNGRQGRSGPALC